MQLARVRLASEYADPRVDALLDWAEIGLLQLDYRRVGDSNCEMAGLWEQFPRFHKSLFLDPALRIVLGAAGIGPVACAEKLAQFLCGQGSADLPLAVVRGDNLLPRWEELLAEGVSLPDQTTRQSLTQIRERMVSARVLLGGGPIATALGEGARMVIAGGYDPAAPLIAAAVEEFGWNWDDWDRLAGIAVAADLADSVARDSLPVLEVTAEGGVKLCWLGEEGPTGVPRQNAAEPRSLRFADVLCDVGGLNLSADVPSRWEIAGVRGCSSQSQWPVVVTYAEGWLGTASWLCDDSFPAETSCQRLLGCLAAAGIAASEVATSIYRADGGALVRLECRAAERRLVERFVREVNHASVRWIDQEATMIERAKLQQGVATRWGTIPAEAVDVSVDTRPARDWT
jgi:hypothetical protein